MDALKVKQFLFQWLVEYRSTDGNYKFYGMLQRKLARKIIIYKRIAKRPSLRKAQYSFERTFFINKIP